MKLARALQQFTKWFHILGQNCYSSFDSISPAYTINFIPSITLLVTMMTTAVATCLFMFYFTRNTFLDYLIIVLCISSLTFTVFIAVIQSISLRGHFEQLFQQINVIDLLTRNRFTINLSAFRRYYLRQIFTISASCFAALCGTLILRPAHRSDMTTTMAVVCLRFVTLITMFHLLFYVCLFQHIVRAFVRYVEIQATAPSTTSMANTNVLPIRKRGPSAKNIIIELNYFKLIHFNLWEICDTMNKVFGWSFTAILLQVSTYAIYNVYFAFVLLITPKLANEPLREPSLLW